MRATGSDELLHAVSSRIPVAERRILETDDPEVANRLFTREFVSHEIEVLGRRRRFYSIAHRARMAGVVLYRAQYRSDVVINAGPLRNHYLVHIPVSGRVRLVSDGLTTEIRPGCIGIVNPFAGHSIHRLDDCTKLTLKFDRADLEQHLFEMTGRVSDRPIAFRSGRPIGFAECRNLVRTIALIEADVFHADGVLNDDSCRPAAETLLARLLLREIPNNQFGDDPPPSAGPAPYYVKRAEAFILEHARQPLSVAEIAAHAGVSARSLFDGFRRFRGVSPMRHVKNVRLDRVRAELVGMRSGLTERQSLTRAAGRWGFEHMGNFSRDYRKRFGELPSETARAGTGGTGTALH